GEERLDRSHEPGGNTARWKEDRTAHVRGVKPGALRERCELATGPELGAPPRARAEPTTNAPVSGPHAEATQLADNDAAARHQHARHLADGALRIRHKAEHRHRYHDVEGGILERQLLGAALLEGHFDSAGSGARLGCVEHLLLEVERRDDGTALSGLDGVGAVAGADVEHALAPQRPREVEDDARLHALGDLAEGSRSPV